MVTVGNEPIEIKVKFEDDHTETFMCKEVRRSANDVMLTTVEDEKIIIPLREADLIQRICPQGAMEKWKG